MFFLRRLLFRLDPWMSPPNTTVLTANFHSTPIDAAVAPSRRPGNAGSSPHAIRALHIHERKTTISEDQVARPTNRIFLERLSAKRSMTSISNSHLSLLTTPWRKGTSGSTIFIYGETDPHSRHLSTHAMSLHAGAFSPAVSSLLPHADKIFKTALSAFLLQA